MKKVLVIDDAREVLELIGEILQPAGYAVTGLEDGTGIEERIEEDAPDLILLDIVLPKRSGFHILRSLRRSEGTRRLPVILVSSKKERTDIEWGKLQGATDYLTKPFSPEQLLHLVARHA